MEKIYQLIYVSHTQANTSQLILASILKISRCNNVRDKLTGLLIYNKQVFFQAIEGDRDEVERCYARIRNDTRHGSPYVVWQGDVIKRSFPVWSMGYRTPYDLDKEDEKSISVLTDLLADNVKSAGSDLLILVLINMLFDGSKGRDIGDVDVLNLS